MPQITLVDRMLLAVSTTRIVGIAALTGHSRYPFPVSEMVSKTLGDRLALSGISLGSGDELLRMGHHRSSISRHYYAMYHAARAVTFAFHGGDDFERHTDLPRNLPSSLDDPSRREQELTAARLLRNQADYDPYPSAVSEWEADARQIAATAADFCRACENLARSEGHV